ncbi:acyltransferase [Rhizobium sp. LCM 4573]|nr:acyltransferase [Rhizobium sp. LCM 4573]
MPAGRRKLLSIQILRGLAAGSVVIAHTIEHPQATPNDDILTLGLFGVVVFFAISGFIISHINSSGHSADARFDPADFLVRRFFRLVPLYWACTILTFLCALFLPSLFKNTTPDIGYFVYSMLFIPAAIPGDPTDWRPLLKLGWSLNYEVFFYILFAAFFWVTSTLRRTVLLTGLLGTMAMAASFIQPNSGVIAFYLNFSLLAFIGGLWLAEAEKRRMFDHISPFGIFAMAAASLGSLWMLFSLHFLDFAGFHGYIWLVIAALALVALALACEGFLRDVGLMHLLVRLGDISYSLYLTHMFVVGFGWFVIKRLSLGETTTGVGMVLIVAACILGASISYVVIEQPFNRVARLFTRKGRSGIAAAPSPSAS